MVSSLSALADASGPASAIELGMYPSARLKFRNSFSRPEPFVPGQKTPVNIKLQDVFHTFKKGHKLQVQVQSTWFPLIDLNPQTFVPNIFKAEESDFKTQTHSVYSDSAIEFTILN